MSKALMVAFAVGLIVAVMLSGNADLLESTVAILD
jgi:hypothetical protein